MVEAILNTARTCVLSQPITTAATADAAPTALEVTETYIIIALDNGEIHTFDIHGADKKILAGSHGVVWALAAWGDLLASGGSEKVIRIWDLAKGQHYQTLQGHTSTVRALHILGGGKRLASASRDTTLRLWDLANGQCIAVSTMHTGTIRSLAVTVPENLLVSGSYDGTACIWRITDNGLVCLHTLRSHEGRKIYGVALNDVGKQVVTAGADAQVRIWNQEDGKCVAVLQGHSGIVNEIKVHGSKLVTSDTSGCICIWLLGDSPSMTYRLETHPSNVISLDFHGWRVVSAGNEGSIKLTDVVNGELLGNLGKDAEVVWKVAFLGENKVISVLRREMKVAMEIWNLS
ncbi:hypothetical protein B7463_g940, partial [Scytalidium lignicola]